MPPGWSMHKLRHRFATRGYAGTGDLLAVKEALGHASVATTQLYTAVPRKGVRAARHVKPPPHPREATARYPRHPLPPRIGDL
jgi:site-specific recombinase XerC